MSLSSLPGDSAFIRLSPIRKPLKPACRSTATVSALPIPLSLTLTASPGRSGARASEVATSVLNVPRLRLLMPHRSGPRAAYSSSASLCISSNTSSPMSWAVRISPAHCAMSRHAAMSSTAEAPQSRALKSWLSSTTKFL